MFSSLEALTKQNLINRNMRCIEMSYSSRVCEIVKPINRNMRCIEIVGYASGVYGCND